MLEKSGRYFRIMVVFIKYNLFSLLYTDIKKDYISDKKCGCQIDQKYRNNAVKLKKAFEELGPTFIKLGQTLSNRPDLLPRPYILELDKLHDDVEVLPFESMRRSFEGSCICDTVPEEHSPFCYHCNDILDLYDEFDTDPIASASIGQVYRAVLKGREVAVKIARPDVIDTINLDLMILKDLKRVLFGMLGFGKDFDVDGFLDDFKDMLTRELDYKSEALNIERFRENFKGNENVKIPDVFWDYTRDTVLVMEFIHGTQIQDLRDIDGDTRNRLVTLISESYLKQIYLDGFFHADPHGGNIIALENDSIALLDFGAVGVLDSELQWNLFNLFYGVYKRDVDIAADYFFRIGFVKDRSIDMHAFKEDMDMLISRQHFSKAGEKQSDNYVMLAVKYNISMPRIFSRLERALFLVEDVCMKLDPAFNIMDEAEALVGKSMRARFSPEMVAKNIQKDATNYYMMFRSLPERVEQTFNSLDSLILSMERNTASRQQRYRILKKGMFMLSIAVLAFAIIVWFT
ncbi:MAG: AarF/UbiB family protein [Methanosarcinales archaeon]|nr:AarF/UbiB family protein [ANME-2 cluster archaeon]MDW7776305.1 AarF/UbiB family protein [Methanosarcinales archaeon]